MNGPIPKDEFCLSLYLQESNVSYQSKELPFQLDMKNETGSKQKDRLFPHLIKRSMNYTANTVVER